MAQLDNKCAHLKRHLPVALLLGFALLSQLLLLFEGVRRSSRCLLSKLLQRNATDIHCFLKRKSTTKCMLLHKRRQEKDMIAVHLL